MYFRPLVEQTGVYSYWVLFTIYKYLRNFNYCLYETFKITFIYRITMKILEANYESQPSSCGWRRMMDMSSKVMWEWRQPIHGYPALPTNHYISYSCHTLFPTFALLMPHPRCQCSNHVYYSRHFVSFTMPIASIKPHHPTRPTLIHIWNRPPPLQHLPVIGDEFFHYDLHELDPHATFLRHPHARSGWMRSRITLARIWNQIEAGGCGLRAIT